MHLRTVNTSILTKCFLGLSNCTIDAKQCAIAAFFNALSAASACAIVIASILIKCFLGLWLLNVDNRLLEDKHKLPSVGVRVHLWPNPVCGGSSPSLAGALLVGLLFRIHGARPWFVRLLCQMGLFWMCNAGSDILCVSVVSSACFHVIPDLCPCKPRITKTRGNG